MKYLAILFAFVLSASAADLRTVPSQLNGFGGRVQINLDGSITLQTADGTPIQAFGSAAGFYNGPIIFGSLSLPAVSASGQANLYFDGTSLKLSANGSAYSALGGAPNPAAPLTASQMLTTVGGSAASPAFYLTNGDNAGNGLYSRHSSILNFATSGVARMEVNGNFLSLRSDGGILIFPGTDIAGNGGSPDIAIIRTGVSAMKISDAGSGYGFVQDLYNRIGSGSPEGVLAAPVGAVYHRTDGAANTSMYVKESGTGNTGWIPK